MSSVRRSRRRADHARELDTALVVSESHVTDIAAAPPQGQAPAVPITRRAKTIKRGVRVATAPVRWTADFAEGVRLYWRGFRMWGTDLRLMLIGVVPGALTAILFGGLFTALFLWLDDVALWTSTRITDNTFASGLIAGAIAFAVF